MQRGARRVSSGWATGPGKGNSEDCIWAGILVLGPNGGGLWELLAKCQCPGKGPGTSCPPSLTGCSAFVPRLLRKDWPSFTVSVA